MARFLVSGFLECVNSSVDFPVAFLVAVNLPSFSFFMWIGEDSLITLSISSLIILSKLVIINYILLYFLFLLINLK